MADVTNRFPGSRIEAVDLDRTIAILISKVLQPTEYSGREAGTQSPQARNLPFMGARQRHPRRYWDAPWWWLKVLANQDC